MHGKRRRKSSSAPFKHKEGNMAAHSYMAEDKYHRATTQESSTTRVDTSSVPNQNSIVLVDPDRYKKEKKQPENKDTLGENIIEYFDPTGVSSWDDAANAYKQDEWGLDEYLDMASAIPFFGKAAKYLRGGKAAINLAKTGSATLGAQKLLDATDTASDIYEDNVKDGVGGGEKKKSKSPSSGWSYYGGIK